MIAYIRDHQHRFLAESVALPTRDEILAMIDTRNPRDEGKRFISLSHKHLAWLYLGHCAPNNRDSRLANGLFRPVSQEADRFAVAYPGFEPYRLFSDEDAPALGARLYFLPGGEDDGAMLFTPPVREDQRKLLGSTELFHEDGEVRLDWTGRELLGRLPLESLLQRQKLYQSIARHLASWSPVLDEVIELRQKQEEEQERRARELEGLKREREETDQRIAEEEERQVEIVATLQQNEDPPERWSIRYVAGLARCRFCGDIAMRGDTVCYNCK
jgi:hypothetical protein